MLKNINSFIIGIILLSGIPMLPAEPNKSSQELQHNIINKNPILVFDNIQNNNLIDNKVIPQIPKRYRIAIHLNPPLHASASAQINLLDLQYLIAEIKKQSPNLANKKIFIVDLRQEPHAILNQNAVSWYGFKNQVANQLEQELIDKFNNSYKLNSSELNCNMSVFINVIIYYIFNITN